jgi:hypothetical protein
MDNVDIEIYLSQVKTFFNQNPEQLIKLLGQASAEEFFNGVKEIAMQNMEKGEDIQLTNNQMIQLVVELNKPKQKVQTTEVLVPYINHKFGHIFLN